MEQCWRNTHQGGQPAPEASSVAEWREDIERLHKGGAQPRAIHDWLKRERESFTGSYPAVKRMCRRPGEARGRVARVRGRCGNPGRHPAGRGAGRFRYIGRLCDAQSGRERKAWVFVLVMGHSRRMVTRIAFDQSAETWIRLHVEAFEELGAVPTVIVPDNLKAAVDRCAKNGNKCSGDYIAAWP